MANASKIADLMNKNIGSVYNPYTSSNTMKFYENELDKKLYTKTNVSNNNQHTSDKNNNQNQKELSQLFKKMIEKRINNVKDEEEEVNNNDVKLMPKGAYFKS